MTPVPAPPPSSPRSTADSGYLLLADISGYTGFMNSVGDAHEVDFSVEVPPGFELVGELLESVAESLAPAFAVAKFEGDAVLAVMRGEAGGDGRTVVNDLRQVYGTFAIRRDLSYRNATESHECVACPLVSALDLKMILHHGSFVRQAVHGQEELLGPAVNVAHRLLKNTVADEVGHRHYLLLTDAAAARLGLPEVGTAHVEVYPDVGEVRGRVVGLSASD